MSTPIFLLKSEPRSPSSLSSNSDDGTWVPDQTIFDWTTLEDDHIDENFEHITESKAQVAAELLESLERLEDLDELIKDEPYWMEDKIVIPIFPNEPQRLVKQSSEDTQNLFQEFQHVFDAVELNNCALTPPQSPPYAASILTPLAPITTDLKPYSYPSHLQQSLPSKIYLDGQPYISQQQQSQELETATDFKRIFIENEAYAGNMSPQSDVDRELAVVEELVRARAENFIPTSPSSSSSSEDPDWFPDDCKTSTDSTTPKRSRYRSKPYGSTGTEDRKSRKKEQNKNAATRYRLKKKAEVEEILCEERQLQTQNEDLENSISDVQREIKYIKGLMRDLFKAKGLL